ncbi:hypothetical protein KSS87_019167 [Heliosperma pusillum]|nr:hypothetical protein KSS87_019167 [Heliosperma pusillum]
MKEGRLIVHTRSYNANNKGVTMQTMSNEVRKTYEVTM